MTALIALTRKDLILYLKDKRALMLHLLMPVVLAAFFGSLFGGSGGGDSTSKIDVGLVLQDQSQQSQKIAAGLKADSALNIVELDQQEAQARVRSGKLPVAVVIPAGFGEAASAALFSGRDKPQLPVYYDPSQSTMLAMVKGLLTQQVMQVTSSAVMGAQGSQTTDKYLAELPAAGSRNADEAQLGDFLASLKKFQDQRAAAHAASASSAAAASAGADTGGGGMTMPYTTHDEALSSGPKYNGYAHSFAGMGVQFILFMGVNLGINILLEQRQGIWSRLLAAPVSLQTVIMSRAAAGAIIATGLMAAMFICAVLIFKVQITSVPGFIGMAVCFGLMTAAFGLLIAAFGKTPEAARGIATFATLILVMLGGAWVPSFVFPQWMQTATLVVPTRWAVDGLDAVTWRGLGMSGAAPAMAVLLGFAVVFGALAVWKFLKDQRQ